MSKEKCIATGDRINQGCYSMLLPKNLECGEGHEDTPGLNILLEVMENSETAKYPQEEMGKETDKKEINNKVPERGKKQKCEPYLLGCEIRENLKELYTNVLERIQGEFGEVSINSGYRSEELNEKVAGKKNSGSRHKRGEAADFVVSGSLSEVYKWAKGEKDKNKDDVKFRKLILYFKLVENLDIVENSKDLQGKLNSVKCLKMVKALAKLPVKNRVKNVEKLEDFVKDLKKVDGFLKEVGDFLKEADDVEEVRDWWWIHVSFKIHPDSRDKDPNPQKILVGIEGLKLERKKNSIA